MNHPLFDLLARLDEAKISYTLARYRPDTVQVRVTVVGQRIEIDVFADGRVDVSRFVGNEDIEGGSELIGSIIAAGS
ncbi:hypothetical protein GXB81_24875 [Paraburkholderia sp. Ac-20336]|uniref:hypothetical protein n=1 Tax=unclassified Paraburkholderia TaxID=2615204 RepID=UPI0019825BB4|nr:MULTISPECIES: hypothetical protein [unclassified Paraburkholderia]MBN3806265.1 hypothetical protein [Paraburkholderia sp. Ac-20336]MBN3850897.1 hypothetical protein [Paraburkholderia sp. Ac-20342]